MIEVQVTEKHIKNGEPFSCFTCAISLALRDSTISGGVAPDEIVIGNKSYATHPQLFDWIKKFDRKETVSPFTLCLAIRNQEGFPKKAPSYYRHVAFMKENSDW